MKSQILSAPLTGIHDPSIDDDELIPVEGKDAAYDEIMQEIRETKNLLNSELKRLEKKAKYDELLLVDFFCGLRF